jgi:hypothetical protein
VAEPRAPDWAKVHPESAKTPAHRTHSVAYLMSPPVLDFPMDSVGLRLR